MCVSLLTTTHYIYFFSYLLVRGYTGTTEWIEVIFVCRPPYSVCLVPHRSLYLSLLLLSLSFYLYLYLCRGFSEILNLWESLNYLCFPIPPRQKCILSKTWFPIIWLAPPYPNFSTDNSFNNPGKTSGDTKYNPPLISQTTFNMSDAGISVHDIVRHNRYIYLSNPPSVKWLPNKYMVASD